MASITNTHNAVNTVICVIQKRSYRQGTRSSVVKCPAKRSTYNQCGSCSAPLNTSRALIFRQAKIFDLLSVSELMLSYREACSMITGSGDAVQAVLGLLDSTCSQNCEKRRCCALPLPECPRDNSPSTLTIEGLELHDVQFFNIARRSACRPSDELYGIFTTYYPIAVLRLSAPFHIEEVHPVILRIGSQVWPQP